MKILQVVHSFPPYTMAGTEVYSRNLLNELSEKHEVSVFFRINAPKAKEYSILTDKSGNIDTYAINRTFKKCDSFQATYNDSLLDSRFGELLDKTNPDIVHIQHLLFLSCGIVDEIKKRNIPIVYTLHDYWLMCHRGQLIKDDLSLCSGDSFSGCGHCLRFLFCLNRSSSHAYYILRRRFPAFLIKILKRMYLLAVKSDPVKELEQRKRTIENVISKVDLFLAPSYFIKNKFIEYGLQKDKIIYSAYGFDSDGLKAANKPESRKVRFAYMGTLLPMKGVDILILAFKGLEGEPIELSVYGKLFSYIGFESYPGFLKRISKTDKRISLKGGYDNKDAVRILSGVDLLIVPSLWLENSPLVIHEAFLSKTPVIASRIGGIPELVEDGKNGLLFNPGDIADLRRKMKYVIDNPQVLEEFRRNIPAVKSIRDNAQELESLYEKLLCPAHAE